MDAPTGVDPREGAKRGENYIPWEQIEPHIRDGMDISALHRTLLDLLGLPFEQYRLRTITYEPGMATMTILRAGLRVVKAGTNNVPPLPNEVLHLPEARRGT